MVREGLGAGKNPDNQPHNQSNQVELRTQEACCLGMGKPVVLGHHRNRVAANEPAPGPKPAAQTQLGKNPEAHVRTKYVCA